MKLEFSREFYENSSNFKFYVNPSSRSRVVPRGETDRHDKANSSFSQYFERGHIPIRTGQCFEFNPYSLGKVKDNF